MHFCPYFFQNQHPELISVGLTEKWLTLLVDRNEVIHDNFFKLTIDSHHYFIDACGCVALSLKNSVKSRLILSQSCQS